jgi:hypothetical protein
LQGIWSGLIGGTAVQTLILAYLTISCDWDEEVNSFISFKFILSQKWTSTFV